MQTRKAVLNGELRDHFERWYPEMAIKNLGAELGEPVKMAA